MKIGILTYHSVPNFGANLQALSTVGFFRKTKYEPVIINWLPEDLELMYRNGRIPEKQVDMHNEFVGECLPVTRLCRNEQDILKVIDEENIEGIFIGSDAVLHHVPNKRRRRFSKRKLMFENVQVTTDRSFPNPFWGNFLGEIKQRMPAAIFSASSQNMPYFEVEGELKRDIGKALSRFDFISVRDKWTADMVTHFTGRKKNIKVTPDPVFAFNNNFTELLSREKLLEKFNLPKKYVLISFRIPKVSKRWIDDLEKEFNKKGLVCVGLPMPEGLISFGLDNTIQLPLDPLDWYSLIKYSSGYVGERMHPIIVSIHNNVPFFCFDEYGTHRQSRFPFRKEYIKESSKIYDLLRRADLLEYSYTYKGSNSIPEPEFVASKVHSFNIEKCKQFSDFYASVYKEAMLNLIDTTFK